nr:F114 [uncultured bacterium]
MLRLFGHHIPRSLLLLLALETLTLLFSFALARAWFSAHSLADAVGSLGEGGMLPAAVLLGSMQLAGLHDDHAAEGMLGMGLRLLGAFAAGVLGLMALALVGVDVTDNGRWIAGGVLLALALISVERICLFRWMFFDRFRRRVLVLGSGARAQEVERLIDDLPSGRRFQLLGYLADAPDAPRPTRSSRPVWYLPQEGGLLDFARRHRVDEVVVAVRERRGKLPVQQLLECKLNDIRVNDVSSFMEREAGEIRLDSLNASWLIFHDGFLRGGLGSFLKRCVDVCASLVLLIPALPVMALAALAIKLEDGGPVLFTQRRVGQHGRTFLLCKLRSMRVDAESQGACWAAENDRRVTWVGGFIRKTRIDELPQIINVLRGEMSFVGPRPERPEFVSELTREIPFFGARHSVKPGITGWAQVRYPYGASIKDSRRKLEYDLYYIKNYSIFLDALILLHTIRVVVSARGAR